MTTETPERIEFWRLASFALAGSSTSVDELAGRIEALAGALEGRFSAERLPVKELTGEIVSIEPTVRLSGRAAGFARFQFRAEVGTRPDTVYINLVRPGGRPDDAGRQLLQKVQQLQGRRVTIRKEGRGVEGDRHWYLIAVDPLGAPAPAPAPAPTPATPSAPQRPVVPVEAAAVTGAVEVATAPDFAALRSLRPRTWEELLEHAAELGLDETACRHVAHATLRQAELETAALSPARVRVVWGRLVDEAAAAAAHEAA